ncbi:hypothetical protein K437DRAFT_260620 [Tilletiaria anomala UBC 951]|uniref:NADP-dependent oxidoreductase domain-containing protein n=1 Tax=Tilletiaria anomala (strain ATCC 24038 / CBS 436.72 / UBC 951) TaxID=1037660 RepID=A0A066WHY1_TILAU|nr:uncharacterized protein K437DRAFT_260620 [Tilletiaria anomala UBC 951]KDN53401.1 hypothetical protein K437DRAFT_260620 [Tilletiaria anomala UBC 951]
MATIPIIRFASNPKPVPIIGVRSDTALFKEDSQQSLAMAIDAGFKLLNYAELWVFTKVLGGMNSGIAQAAKDELAKSNVLLLDSCILHTPPRGNDGQPSDVEVRKEMEKLKDEGIVKYIFRPQNSCRAISCLTIFVVLE